MLRQLTDADTLDPVNVTEYFKGTSLALDSRFMHDQWRMNAQRATRRSKQTMTKHVHARGERVLASGARLALACPNEKARNAHGHVVLSTSTRMKQKACPSSLC